MPCQLQWEPCGVVCRFTSEESARAVIRALEAIGADMRFDRLRYVICDFLDGQDRGTAEADIEEIMALVFAHSLSNPNIHYASIAVDPQVRAMVRRYERMLGRPDRHLLCASESEARAWLGLAPAPLAVPPREAAAGGAGATAPLSRISDI